MQVIQESDGLKMGVFHGVHLLPSKREISARLLLGIGGSILFVGILIVLLFGASLSGKATIFEWMLACLLSGIFAGFLFGVPKVIQKDQSQSIGAGTDASAKGANSLESIYQPQVNSIVSRIGRKIIESGLGLMKGCFSPIF